MSNLYPFQKSGGNEQSGGSSKQKLQDKQVSSQKEMQIMLNTLLGKLFSNIEVVLQRAGCQTENNYKKYMGNGTENSSTTDLLRNIKTYITALCANTCDSNDTLIFALSSPGVAQEISTWLQMTAQINDYDQSMVTAKKLLTKVLLDLRDRRIEMVDHNLSNEIRNIKERDELADQFVRNNQHEAIKMIHRTQLASNHMTKEMEKMGDNEMQFSRNPSLNMNPKDIKDMHHGETEDQQKQSKSSWLQFK